ncbi:MAG: hypothetical protein LDL19_09135 [Thiobacillus sp.]|nr:hypothetical protein [Thiobacillus sp.]
MPKTPSEAYLEKASKLPKAQIERLLSRSRNKLMRRMLENKLTPIELAAIQLEIEDEALAEWRERMAEIKRKEAEKLDKKAARTDK